MWAMVGAYIPPLLQINLTRLFMETNMFERAHYFFKMAASIPPTADRSQRHSWLPTAGCRLLDGLSNLLQL
jgi:hypothetical protein